MNGMNFFRAIINKRTEYNISSNQNIYFVDSVVQGLTNRVISYDNLYGDSNTRLLLESCNFDNISVSNNRGGVILYRSNGEVVHNKICSNQCKLNGYNQGVYSYHYVTRNANSKNYIIESSVVKSFSQNGGTTLDHSIGDIKLSISNITDSDTSYNPCINLASYNKDTEISYMVFSNNTGRNIKAALYHYGSYKYFYSFCDILDNQCQEKGVLWFDSDCIFASCNLVNNNAATKVLFYMNSGVFVSKSCYIDNPNANNNHNVNSISTTHKQLIQPFIIVGCQGFVQYLPGNCHKTCANRINLDRSLYMIFVVFLDYNKS